MAKIVYVYVHVTYHVYVHVTYHVYVYVHVTYHVYVHVTRVRALNVTYRTHGSGIRAGKPKADRAVHK